MSPGVECIETIDPAEKHFTILRLQKSIGFIFQSLQSIPGIVFLEGIVSGLNRVIPLDVEIQRFPWPSSVMPLMNSPSQPALSVNKRK